MELFTKEMVEAEPDCACGKTHLMDRRLLVLVGAMAMGDEPTKEKVESIPRVWPIAEEYQQALNAEANLIVNDDPLNTAQLLLLLPRIAEQLEREGHTLAPLVRMITLSTILKKFEEEATSNALTQLLSGARRVG